MPRGVPLISNFTVDSAHGSTIRTLEGVDVLDFASGIGVTGTGHTHPEVVEAITTQARRLLHACIHVATYEPYVALCERLVQLLPHGGPTKAMLLNSGAEAVENAIKIARQATGRPSVICFEGAFHGRTLLGMSLTSKVRYKSGCGPLAPEIYRVPFADYFHGGDGLSEEAFVARELHRLDEAFSVVVAAEQVAAIIVEPVLGEGGIIPAPPAWLRGLRKRCDQHGILLIFDEVQTGFCRTGDYGAFQVLGVTPDLSTWAKAMASGLPISAVVGRADVMDAAQLGTIGGTFGGNPVAAAAALATLTIMEREQLGARAVEVGAIIRSRLEPTAEKLAGHAQVRGLGAMIGIELYGETVHDPDGAAVADVLRACHERGLLVIGAGVHGSVIRILTPLTIATSELERGLGILTDELMRRAG